LLDGAGQALHSFACETENEPPAPPIYFMKTTLAFLSAKWTRCYATESRLVFWNLFFTMVLSSLLLFAYLKRILFDF
jgi:hypothetical protein